MKNMKKLFSLALALVMMMALVVTAGATSTNPAPTSTPATPTGSITVDKAVDGATYNAYRLLDLESFAGTEKDDAHAYTLRTDGSKWNDFFNQQTVKGVYVEINENTDPAYVTWVENADAEAFAALALKYAQDNDIAADAHDKAANKTVALGQLPMGYYLVDAGIGSLIELTTNDQDIKIEEKNTDSSIDKVVKNDTDKTIGDSVDYEINVPIVKGAVNYKVSDVMGKGLKFNSDLTISLVSKTTDPDTQKEIESVEAFPNDKYKETVATELGDKIFEIKFDDAFLAANEGKTIRITYSATITKEAIIWSEKTDDYGNTWNQATLGYGNEKHVETDKNDSKVELYKVTVNKVDSKNTKLDGAKFKLYDKDKTTEIPVVKVSDGVYRPAVEGETGVEIDAGTAVIKGLTKGTYYLDETVAPDGYNKLKDKVSVKTEEVADPEDPSKVIEQAAQITGDTETNVVNNTGTELPSTGGIGTTIFTVTGAILMIGAAVLFLTKKRSEA